MKMWTVQKAEVLHELERHGIYYPDFTQSDFINKIPGVEGLYYTILESFNSVNFCKVPGLIFTFVETWQDDSLSGFEDFIKSKQAVIGSLWRQLSLNPEQSVVLELDIEYPFLNPLLLDMNDFQFLMPPITVMPPFDESDGLRIIGSLSRGEMPEPRLPSGVVQAHLPFIAKESVVSVHPLLPLR